VREAKRRQTAANDAAQIVIGPVRQRDGVMILAATAGYRPQGAQHAAIQIALDLGADRQWILARTERK
jgi:hypothetical protein